MRKSINTNSYIVIMDLIMKGLEMKKSEERRRRELAKIHIGAEQLGMDDDAYRAMLFMP